MELSASVFVYCKNRGEENTRNQTRFSDLGELEQSAAAFPHDDAVVLSPSILSLIFLSIYVLYAVL